MWNPGLFFGGSTPWAEMVDTIGHTRPGLTRKSLLRYQITAAFGHPPAGVRSIVASLFPDRDDAIYFAGYDANEAPTCITACIARVVLSLALGPSGERRRRTV
jgi:hypothetical protein